MRGKLIKPHCVIINLSVFFQFNPVFFLHRQKLAFYKGKASVFMRWKKTQKKCPAEAGLMVLKQEEYNLTAISGGNNCKKKIIVVVWHVSYHASLSIS